MTVEERLTRLEERMERNEGRALALWGAISTAIACLDPEVMEVVKTTLKKLVGDSARRTSERGHYRLSLSRKKGSSMDEAQGFIGNPG